MNRFSAREFGLLMAPVLLMAGGAWWLSRRPAPPAPAPPKPLRLDFRLEKPTTLEAFKGADAALVTRLKGTGASALQMNSFNTDPYLELRAGQTPQISRVHRGYSGVWRKVWKGNYSEKASLRLPIRAAAIPAGTLVFGFDTTPAPGVTMPASKLLPVMKRRWPLDRSKIQPFAFETLPRAPLIVLRSVKVVAGSPPGWVTGECVFDLTGAAMNARTPLELDLGGGGYNSSGLTSGISHSTIASARRRVCRWKIGNLSPLKSRTVGRLSGRASADERWPLGFQIEPFDMARVKVGQALQFKQWPLEKPDAGRARLN